MGNRFAVGCATLVSTFALMAAPAWAADAQSSGDPWVLGVGTGFSSFTLEGDLGFATSAGGTIRGIDLSNSETSDLVESGFGLAGFARNSQWTILWSAGTQTLEDQDGGVDAEWDRTQAELSATYKVVDAGANSFGALFGLRYTSHDWNIRIAGPASVNSPDEDWTDVILGATHQLAFADRWTWNNRVDYGFGGSEGTAFASTTLNWRPFDHWAFNVSAQYLDTEYGDASDITKADFYYYNVEQTLAGIGFAYVW